MIHDYVKCIRQLFLDAIGFNMMKIYSQSQQGAILAIALILLVILTLVAVSFARISSLDIRGAKNYSDNSIMLAIAESALIDAETAIEVLDSPNNLNNEDGFYAQGDEPPDPFDPKLWEEDVGINTDTSNPGLSAFYVEEIMLINESGAVENISVSLGGYGEDSIQSVGDTTIFRSVIHAQNPSGTGTFMLESFYGKVF